MTFPDEVERRAARLAALTYFPTFIAVVWVNIGVMGRLVSTGDPTATVRNLAAGEALVRAAVLGNVFYAIGVLLLCASFYVILRRVDRTLALFASLGRLAHGISWIIVTVNLLRAVRLSTSPTLAEPFSASQLAALVSLDVSSLNPYYVGLLFWSVGGTVGAWLWLRSGLVPRALGWFGLFSSGWCVVCTAAYLADPAFARTVNLWLFDSPMVLFEMGVCALLLRRSFRHPSQPKESVA